MAGHEDGIPHFTLIFHMHDMHLTANLELPFAAKVRIHAEDAGSTWPRGLQAPQPEIGSRLLKHIFHLAVNCAAPIS